MANPSANAQALRIGRAVPKRPRIMALILHPRIRRFEPGDLRGILRLERACFGMDAWRKEAFEEYAGAVPKLFLVARIDGRLAGYSIATPARHGGEIDSLAVLPMFRRYGVATALLRASIRKLRRAGARSVSLMVRRGNTPAIALYRSLGFRRVATVARYYPRGVTAWRMRLELP